MDQTQSPQPALQPALSQAQQKRTDIAVISAMSLVALAISVALSVHFGLPMSRAVVAGGLIFALLAGAHFFLVPRADTAQDVTELEDEELWRALKEQRRNAPDAKRMAMATRGDIDVPTPEPKSEPSPGVSPGASPVAADTAVGEPMQHTEPANPDQPAQVMGQMPEDVSQSTNPSEATASPVAQHVPRRQPRIIPHAQTGNAAMPSDTTVSADVDDVPAPHPAQMETPTDVSTDGAGSENFWSYRPSRDAVGTEPGFAPAQSEIADFQVSDSQVTETQVFEPQLSDSDVPVAAEAPVQQHDLVQATPNPAAAAHLGEGEATAKRPSESDVELVQSMIKKLAHQINARDLLEQTAPTQDAPNELAAALEGDAAAPGSSPPQMQPPQLPSHDARQDSPYDARHDAPQPGAPAMATEPQIIAQSAPPPAIPPAPPSTPAAVDVVTESVGALRETAGAMRDADAAAPDDAPQVDQPVRPAAQRDAGHVAGVISSALAANEVGVLLEPIVALNGMRPDHYEVSVQLSQPSSVDLESANVESALQATGVLPEIDRARFIKTISVGELLRDRGKVGSLLTRIYRESLLDRDFCFAVATSGVANEELARHMVLSLSQDAVRALTASEWQTLSEFHELGYRFAVSHVSDLDMDFAQLTAAGFGLVKLDAKAFLDGFLDGEGAITPQELSRYLSHVGLTVIVEGLASSAQAADTLAMGVSLGQGPVTGGPRLLKSEAVVRDDHAVA